MELKPDFKSKIGTEYAITTFCYLIVEEFLMKKEMYGTLDVFRTEWKRPDDVTANIAWCDIALKLHLAEMMQSSEEKTAVEGMCNALLTESSIRSRRPKEVIVSGLAEIPREKSLPPLEIVRDDSVAPNSYDSYASVNTMAIRRNPSLTLPLAKGASKHDQVAHIEKKTKAFKFKMDSQPLNKNKTSHENWVPEQVRLRSIQRTIHVLEENVNEAIVRESEQQRELRRYKTTDLAKAKLEESLGSKRKTPCACCLQMYSYVNLTMKIPQKAIIDIRKKWSNNSTDGWWVADDERLSAIPRCYDGVKICRFCSQFFGEQEKYRPSFVSILLEQRNKAYLEAKQREKEYWDPLLMCEKDREREESMLAAEQSSLPAKSIEIEPSMSTIDYE